MVKLWMELTSQLISFPRHLSQHPGGFVIAKGRMAELVPVENASMKDRSVIQWDKDDLDALGLLEGRHPRHRHAERDPARARLHRRAAWIAR